MSVLQIRHVSHMIQDRTLFEIESLQVEEEERIGLIGRNGSGKTSLLKMIAGSIPVDVDHINNLH